MCEDAPLLGPLPAPASQGEDEKARSKNFAEKSHILMDPNKTRFEPFDTRLIVRKGCVDSSKIRLLEPKLPAMDSERILTLPPTGKSGRGAPVSDVTDPAFLVRARGKAPGRRPALRWQRQDAPPDSQLGKPGLPGEFHLP